MARLRKFGPPRPPGRIGRFFGFLARVALWFIAAAFGPGPLGIVHVVFASWIGQIILFLFTWTLFHHLLGGIRHFIFDFGGGFSHDARFGLAWANIIGSIILTLLAYAFFVWF